MKEISGSLRHNAPPRIPVRSDGVWLCPHRAHYVVREEVERARDRD